MKNTYVGEKIAEYRKVHNMTIKDFSMQTGLSCALISQLERDIGNPTLYALTTISEALGISLSTLLEQKIDNEALIQRQDKRNTIFESKDHQTMHDLLSTGNAHSSLEMILMRLEPHNVADGRFKTHKSVEEIGFVLEGEATVGFEGEEFTLYKGDTIRILPGRLHLFENRTDNPLAVLFARYRY